MEITEEQRKRAETNRLAALAKRKALMESSKQNQDQWKLSKCPKSSHQHGPNFIPAPDQPLPSIETPPPPPPPHLPQKFLVRLEICSPDSFSTTPLPLRGFPFPGEEECLRRLTEILSNVIPSHYTQNCGGGKAGVYKLIEYWEVVKYLKVSAEIEFEEIPWGTLNVVDRLSHSLVAGRWIPCLPEHLSDEKVDELTGKLPRKLFDALMPFQFEGLKFGLRRGGRCLIADEMGLGKTLQAIAIAGCFMDEGPILVVCPAILRFSWAEELERWLPHCLPADMHLVFGHQNNPAYLTRHPRIVVISYTMLHRLQKSMLEQEWAVLIVDESHHVRCTKKSEPGETKAVLDVASKVKRIVLLSGTPSLSRPFDIFHQINILWPGLLGRSKYEFAKTYCAVKSVETSEGKVFQDFSKGVRLEELNVLLKQTVMIRRLKQHVLLQLPPKRRQIIRLLLKKSDIIAAKAATGSFNLGATEKSTAEDGILENKDQCDDVEGCKSGKLSNQELGIAKLSGFHEWLSIHPLVAERDSASDSNMTFNSQKMIIFAHHLKVLDGVQEYFCEKEISFVRIDGRTPPKDRQDAVISFRSSSEVKVAIIGITAAGVGLDFSSAQNVVFLELPESPSLMHQAEDRAHRQGQTNAVNVYIFCAKDTADESHWRSMNRSLHRVSSTTDGKYDAIQEIKIEGVSYLETSGQTDHNFEDQPSAKAIVTESTKLPDAGPENLQSCKAYSDKPVATVDDKLEKLTYIDQESNQNGLDHMADRFSCLEMGKASTKDGKLEAEFLEFVNESCKSTPQQDKSVESKDQKIKEHKLNPKFIRVDGDQSILPVEPDGSCANNADSLRFEVSPYTGRIHLYACVPGTDTRPRPLFENFRPEELESLSCLDDDDKVKRNFLILKDNPSYWYALLEFNKEWNNLRPIEQKKLYGKPLQLPLAVELCYLSEGIHHHNGGLLNGGSKRRMTPFTEISCPLPPYAVLKNVSLHNGFGKKKKEYTQGWTPEDGPLCKLCQKPCMGKNARSPDYFEDLFCNLSCHEEYHLRTSNKFLRKELFQIERGVCTNCKLNCHKLVEHIRPLSLESRRKYVEKVAPKVGMRKNLLEKLVNEPIEGNAWHADHIIPVFKGGGECRLENMRTLCVACHYDVTTAQCAERHLARIKAKKQLKVIMSNFGKVQTTDSSETCMKGRVHACLETEQSATEDDLLVSVPGSSYCEV